MNGNELFRAGKLNEAIAALTGEVKESPLDSRRRTFLFELLCFAGEWDRATKQLDVLAQGGAQAELGCMLYRAALNAEKQRKRFFENRDYVNNPNTGSGKPVSGRVNGKDFKEISDADPRIGARLEVFVAGNYLWVPFEHIHSIEFSPPKLLRNLLWATAIVRNGPAFKGRDLGELMIPVLASGSFTHPSDHVRLGRVTIWEEEDGLEIPFGQKMMIIDGEEVPLLDLKTLEFSGVANVAAAS